MKKIILLAVLLLPIIAFGSDRFRSLEGRWINIDYGNIIKIKERRGFIKVKGLNHRNRWLRFERARNGRKFRDCDGNIIRLTDRGQLVYKNRRRGFKTYFGRRNHSSSFGYSRRSNRDWGYRNNWGEYRGDLRKGRNDRSSSFRDLTGIWNADLINKKVYIERSNRGWKVKVGRKGKWNFYEASQYNERSFIDKRGNSLELFSDGSLVWKGGIGYKDLRLRRQP